MNKSYRFKVLLIVVVSMFLFTSCNLPSRSSVQATITSPEAGETLAMGSEVAIQSLAVSSRGIESVEFYINGELFGEQTPPDEETPDEFTADQLWTPEEEGEVIITVAAYDTRGNHSDPVSITVQVVQSIAAGTITPTITTTPEGFDQTQTAQVGCTNEAAFVSDVTIPANSEIPGGTNFTKTWRVTNTGTCDWIGYQVILADGLAMSASSPQALPVVNSGENVDISIDMLAPASSGVYAGTWWLRAPDGTGFGPDLNLSIVVPVPPTEEPEPTITPTVTPTNTATTAPISVDQIYEQISLSAGSTDSTTVTCPAGSVVTSGGYAASSGVRVWHSTKNGNGWRVFATNTAGSSKLLNVYATCLANSGGTTDIQLAQENIAANTQTNIEAPCPGGTIVTGGGWVIGSDDDVEIYNSTKNGNGWQIYVNNTGGGTPLINAYAICLSGASGTSDSVGNTGNTIPANDNAHVVMECPGGSYPTGGGFATNLGVTIYNSTISGNGWQIYARNPFGTSKTVNGYAICYSP
jgi:hypothetical protein